MTDAKRTTRFAHPVPLPSREGLGEGLLALLVGIVLAINVNLRSDVIQLRSSVTTEAARIALKDIAILEGAQAEQLGDLQVMTLTSAQQSVGAEEIRRMLEARHIHWGRITLRGATTVQVRRLVTPVSAPVKTAANPIGPVTTEPAPPTLRRRIADWVKQNVAADESDLKITFDEQQAALLDACEGDRLEFEPMNRDVLGRIPLVIRRYHDNMLLSTLRMTLDVQQRRMAVTLKRAPARNQPLAADDLELQPVWLDSTLKQPAGEIAAVAGKMLRNHPRVGSVICLEDLITAAVIKRGEKVVVRCVSGSIVIRTEGRAAEDGTVGSIISIKREIPYGKRTIESVVSARIIGPGEAVMVAEPADAPIPTRGGRR